jgi:hypothetical protein
MTRVIAKTQQDDVNSHLSTCDFGTPMDVYCSVLPPCVSLGANPQVATNWPRRLTIKKLKDSLNRCPWPIDIGVSVHAMLAQSLWPALTRSLRPLSKAP